MSSQDVCNTCNLQYQSCVAKVLRLRRTGREHSVWKIDGDSSLVVLVCIPIEELGAVNLVPSFNRDLFVGSSAFLWIVRYTGTGFCHRPKGLSIVHMNDFKW